MTLLQICEWLETTWAATIVRESAYGFQIFVALHLLGLGLSVGMLVWFDLRLLGITMRMCRVSEVYRRLIPWALAGFAVMFVTGAFLFTGYATSAYGNLYFRIKLSAMALAALNALVFHLKTERTIARWDDATRPPSAARFAGVAAIVLWGTVVLCGRMMSYTLFSPR
jgi:signal transduction histidine kinase